MIMHQEYERESCAKPSKKDELLAERNRLHGMYRNAVIWSCKVLNYKRLFEREEDYGEDGLTEHVDFLQDDSRRELREVSLYIKNIRKKIDKINNQLMDIAGGA